MHRSNPAGTQPSYNAGREPIHPILRTASPPSARASCHRCNSRQRLRLRPSASCQSGATGTARGTLEIRIERCWRQGWRARIFGRSDFPEDSLAVTGGFGRLPGGQPGFSCELAGTHLLDRSEAESQTAVMDSHHRIIGQSPFFSLWTARWILWHRSCTSSPIKQ